jgi:hypothetical protein
MHAQHPGIAKRWDAEMTHAEFKALPEKVVDKASRKKALTKAMNSMMEGVPKNG